MITELKNVANQIANSRVRLSSPFQDKQTREDIIKESKNLEALESNLRNIINELEENFKLLLE